MSATQSPWIFDANDSDFDDKVLQQSREKPVLVDFWAPWCGPCRMLGPLLEKAIHDRGGEVLLAKVNTDQNPRVAAQYYIQALPTVMAFRDGQPIDQFQGVIPEEYIRQFISQVLPSGAEKLVAEAAALEKTDAARAEELYRQALAQDERLDKAMIGLARLLVQRQADEEAGKLLENEAALGDLEEEAERLRSVLALRKLAREFGEEQAARRRVQENPNDAEARYQLGCILAAGGNYSEALDLLLSAGEKNHSLATSKVREAMVRVFHVVGTRSPLADEYRQKLSAILY